MIPEIKNILFTTDLSKNAKNSFYYALSLSSRYDANIILLHVMEDYSSSTRSVHLESFLGKERWEELQKSHEDEARQILIGKKRDSIIITQALGEFCESAKAEMDQTKISTEDIVVARGNTVDEILSLAKQKNCDLIVMGYYVRGKLGEAFLGSTARRVIRRSKIPVLLVRLDEKEA
ncbi:MAG: universal stress protein [Thermodesulfobacteriota bacterium]|nr:universal stress protein [Thermodesulfobacteriota bacterium]